MNSVLPEVVCNETNKTGSHAIVIGSGFGGLASAIRLSAKGYKVTVLEKLDAAGGRAYVYRQNGFTFDGGPTIITAPKLFEELWSLCGRRFEDDIDLREMNPFYRIRFNDGETFDCTGDHEKMRAEIERISPSDLSGYEGFMKASKRRFEIGWEQMARQNFSSIFSLIKFLPKLISVGAHRSVYSLAAKFFKHPHIRFVMSFHPLFLGGNPFTSTSVFSLVSDLERRWGVHSPMGGTGALINGLVNLVESQGTKIHYNAEVDEILVENKKAIGVRLKSGEILTSDIVVSNAEAAWTYRHLVASTHRRRWTNRRLRRSRYSEGLFVWYFGTKKKYQELPHHTILVGPRYKEHLDDIFKYKRLASDFSLYLYRPTATDPSLAPEGCDSFYALSVVPHLESGVDWEKESESYREAIQRRLEETVMPGLSDNIAATHILTPQDFQDRLNSYQGAGFSFEPVIWQLAWFRPHNRSEEIEGLYLVGAGTHPGAGVPAVLTSAQILEEVVPLATVTV